MSNSLLPKRILLAVETAALAKPALEFLGRLAPSIPLTIDLVHVWEPVPFTPPDAAFYQGGEEKSYRKLAQTHAEEELDAAARYAEMLGLMIGQQHIREGAPSQTILGVAEKLGVDWVVTTSHQRHGVNRWLQGSVGEKVARLSPCHVLTIPVHPTA